MSDQDVPRSSAFEQTAAVQLRTSESPIAIQCIQKWMCPRLLVFVFAVEIRIMSHHSLDLVLPSCGALKWLCLHPSRRMQLAVPPPRPTARPCQLITGIRSLLGNLGLLATVDNRIIIARLS